MHLVCVFGPPAVGKMRVGHELTRRTGYKLFHNHMTIEPFLGIFDFDSESFQRLSGDLRRRVVEEAVDAGLDGLVFTFVWGLEREDDRDFVAGLVDLVESRGGRVSFVELAAPLEVRLARNGTDFRLDHKRSKRDRDFSDRNMVELERYLMNTGGAGTIADTLLQGRDHLRIENSELSPERTADRIVRELGLAGP